jgi:uroporphyrin-III C-methyltransferase
MEPSGNKDSPEGGTEARDPVEQNAAAQAEPQSEAEDKAPARARRSGGGIGILALLLALLALAAVAWQWNETRTRIGSTQEELARRLRDMETEGREARSLARQAQEATREMQAKVTQLDTRLTEAQSQQLALEALYQELSRNRDEWQLAEIEQVLEIASQQLQLSGNVRAALLALQLAEARLARGDRPQFMPVRRALARDIERLKALPALDLPSMSMKLDALGAAVDALPLAFEERIERSPIEKPATSAAKAQNVLARLGAEIWGELKQLVVVRRVDAPEPPLIAPTQAYFLRENLRLRLLNARVSLLMRNETGYREDLRAAQGWVERYFDTRSRKTAEVQAQLKTLASVSLNLELPSIAESLEAVRGFKARRERGS